MVATTSISRTFAALAGVLMTSGSFSSASPMDMAKRDGEPPTIKDSKFYHFTEVPPEDDKGMTQELIGLQPLSLAHFEGNQEARFFWFVEKHPVFKALKDPGTGCQLVLYYDNIKQRASDWDTLSAQGLNDTMIQSSKWVKPAAVAPWCNPQFVPSAYKEFKSEDLGFISVYPRSDADVYPSAFATYR
jgi:hypothetical protein